MTADDRESLARQLANSLRERGAIRSDAVLRAFGTVPRHLFLDRVFVPGPEGRYASRAAPEPPDNDWLQIVYQDSALTVAIDEHGRPASASTAPWLMAMMLEALEVRPGMKVLEIGTGTGYNAAILAELVGSAGSVDSIEISPELAHYAQSRLAKLGYTTVRAHVGDGTSLRLETGPFDRILVTAAHHRIAGAWSAQLGEGGILVMNLLGSLAGALAVLERIDIRKLRGHLLDTPNIAFTTMRDSDSGAGPDPGRLFDLCPSAGSPVIERGSLTAASLRLRYLRPEERSFRWLLQFIIPGTQILWVGPPSEVHACVITPEREAVLFAEDGARDEWQVRGSAAVWAKLVDAVRTWTSHGRPDPTSYELMVTGESQRIILRGGPAWPLPDARLTSAPAHARRQVPGD